MIPMLECMLEEDLVDLVASEEEEEAVLELILKTYLIWALVEDLEEEPVEDREAGREVGKVKEQLIHFLLVEVVQEATDSKCEDRL